MSEIAPDDDLGDVADKKPLRAVGYSRVANGKQAPPGRAYGYVRASTEDQEDTLPAQEHAVRGAYAARLAPRGYTWGGLYVDRGVSGAVEMTSRPAGHRLTMELERGDIVIVHKIDRGWRSVLDACGSLERWRRRGVGVVVVDLDLNTSTPEGKAMFSMLALFSEFERGMISQRMRAFQAQRKRAGRPHCKQAPYGYRLAGPKGNRHYAPCPEQRAIGRRIVEWVDAGWSYRCIVEHLFHLGIVHPVRGTPLRYFAVYDWARRERALMAQGK